MSKVKVFLMAVLLVLCASLMACTFDEKANAWGGDLDNSIARVQNSVLSEDDLIIRSQNRIFFPYDKCAKTGKSSNACGDNAREIYWSALNQYIDDPVKIAGIVGNLMNEGGMNPVAWEGSITNGDGSLSYSWDYIYGGGLDGARGVGSFGITSGLSEYLHYINDNYPELLKYFQNSKEYGFNFIHPGSGANPTYGDTLLEKIGEDEYGKLVEAEIKYAIEDSPIFAPNSKTYMGMSFANPSAAAYWWMDEWERPAYRNSDDREREAEKVYDELKDFHCTGKSSSSSSSSGTSATAGMDSDITLIGDSISVMSESKLQEKFPGGFLDKIGSRHSTSGSLCGDNGGLDALKKIVAGSGSVPNQNMYGDCGNLNVDSNSLKENVVWALGTNTGGATRETIDEVIKLIGKQRKLFLVTPYNDNQSGKATTDGIADMYRQVANEHDNVYIVDWNNKVREDVSRYLQGDGYHPTSDGSQLFADLIVEAVGSTGNCAMANTYKDKEYVERLSGLHTFNQGGGTWKDRKICSGGGVVWADGCGLMSLFGMYYMFSGKGLNDEQVFNEILTRAKADGYMSCSGSRESGYGEQLTEYTGMTIEQLFAGHTYQDSDWDSLVDALKQGKKILIGTTSSSGGGSSVFAAYMHALYLDHYNDKKDAIYLFDPGMHEARAAYTMGAGPTGDIHDGVYISRKQMNDYVRPDAAFPLTYYGQTCYNECEESGGSVDGGLNEEQAQKLADYYNNNVDADEWGLPGKLNCVSLSMWFAEALTSIGINPNISDNGNGVAHQVQVVGNLEEGNDPRPYSIFSVTKGNVMCGNEKCGHTGVIVGVNGDDVITIEAGWPSTPAEVGHRTKDYFENARFGKSITYLEKILKKSDLASMVGR